jgi:phosphoglycolate phosphatase
MAKLRLVVFDLDGTLVDSRRDLAESANELLTEHGCRPLSEHAIGRMVGSGAATLVARAFAAAGRSMPPGALDRFLAIYDSRLLRFTRPYPGMADVLVELERRVPLGVLTNKPVAATSRILQGLGLARFFANRVLGGDGPFPRKPDPAGLLSLASGTSAAAADTMLVGDSAIDWRTARAARTQLCLARYGFGFEDVPAGELEADVRIIDAPGDLRDVVRPG